MNDKILERIRALLALSTSDNEYEAASAAAKAQELLLKYNLEVSQTDIHADDDKVQRFNWDRDGAAWQDSLLNAIATTNFCKVVQSSERNMYKRILIDGWGYAVFGSKTNVEIVQYLFNYLLREIKRLTPNKGRSYEDSFRKGCVAVIHSRLVEGMKKFNVTSETRALVHVKDAEVNKEMAIHFPRLRSASSTIGSNAGFNHGYEVGKSIPLHTGVETTNQAGQKLLS